MMRQALVEKLQGPKKGKLVLHPKRCYFGLEFDDPCDCRALSGDSPQCSCPNDDNSSMRPHRHGDRA